MSLSARSTSVFFWDLGSLVIKRTRASNRGRRAQLPRRLLSSLGLSPGRSVARSSEGAACGHDLEWSKSYRCQDEPTGP